MRSKIISNKSFHSPSEYQITLEGAIDQNHSSRLAGLSVQTTKSGDQRITTLTGSLIDQAELHGVLNTLYNYRCTVLSVTRISQ